MTGITMRAVAALSRPDQLMNLVDGKNGKCRVVSTLQKVNMPVYQVAVTESYLGRDSQTCWRGGVVMYERIYGCSNVLGFDGICRIEEQSAMRVMRTRMPM
jgi:hypothetical protein